MEGCGDDISSPRFFVCTGHHTSSTPGDVEQKISFVAIIHLICAVQDVTDFTSPLLAPTPPPPPPPTPGHPKPHTHTHTRTQVCDQGADCPWIQCDCSRKRICWHQGKDEAGGHHQGTGVQHSAQGVPQQRASTGMSPHINTPSHTVSSASAPRPLYYTHTQTLSPFQEFAGAHVVFGDVTNPASITAAAFSGDAPVDVVVSCLASRTGGKQDSWAVDYQVRYI
jgi:hypothetical protein